MQHWRRLGRVFVPDGSVPSLATHAATPFVDHIEDSNYFVYFAGRDRRGWSATGRFVLDMEDPTQSMKSRHETVLLPGGLGTFDAHGAMATCMLRLGARKVMHYIGWNRGYDVPFRNALGIAVSDDGGETFEKWGGGPVLDRSIHDPCFVAGNCVVHDSTGHRMWYLSCLKWEQLPDGSFRHHYHIKEAESPDGFAWAPTGRVSIDFMHPGEYAISRPHVMALADGGYEMWYSYRAQPRTETYRIGYATSVDGTNWIRDDAAVGLEPSDTGWDSDMVCYGHVFDYEGDRFMLYNGDGYGATGVGLAMLES